MRALLAVAVLAMLVLVGCLQSGTSGVDDADATSPDGDGGGNGMDRCPGTSSPSQSEANGDGTGDACDADWGGDDVKGDADDCPAVANSGQDDLDGDGRGDACDEDVDGDGIENAFDNCPSTPNAGQEDADGDWAGNVCDDDMDDERLVSGTPRIELSFTGFLGNRGVSAYGSIAAGIDHVVASTHDEVGIFLKNGSLVGRTSHNHFFQSVLPARESLTDPRVSYDYQSNRFFVVAASGTYGGCQPNYCPNTWTVAVSKTDSPNTLTSADWYFWAFDATLTDGRQSGLWGDFSIVAADERIVVINGQMIHHYPEPESVYDRLWVFEKSDLLTGKPISKPEKEFYNIKDPKTGETLRQRFLPATNLEDPGGIFFAHMGIEDCDMIVGQVSSTASGASAAELIVRNVPVPGKACRETARPGEQLGGGPPISIIPHITSAPVYQDGSLWIAQVVPVHYANGLVNGVRILKLDVSAWPSTPIIEEDQTLSEEGASYAYPAMVVSRAGDVVVMYNRMSPSTYISLYYTGRLATDHAGTFHDAVPFMPGKAYHDYPGSSQNFLHFAAHSGAALDPVDDSAWLIGQYPERPCVWGERIARVVFTDGGEAQSPPPPSVNGREYPC